MTPEEWVVELYKRIPSWRLLPDSCDQIARVIRAAVEEATAKYRYGGMADIRECSKCKTPYPDYTVSSSMCCWQCREGSAIKQASDEAYQRGVADGRIHAPEVVAALEKVTELAERIFESEK
jgi:hypothetical protein